MKIFISHSSKDKETVISLSDLLINYFKIEKDSIFCTSFDDSLKVGIDFNKEIKKQLNESDMVILLISENYMTQLHHRFQSKELQVR